jgi:xanthine dehydrogenase accessory factor
MTSRLLARETELQNARVPYVYATVVRAQSPTSSRPGDDAIILGDGSIEGFVGGQCAEESVRRAALNALESGESVLLRVLPEGDAGFPNVAGAQVAVNPCLSGGALEIFLEPHFAMPLVVVVGSAPIALATTRMTDALGYRARLAPSLVEADFTDASAVVIATHGHDEPEAIRAALDAGVQFIGLVASAKRGGAVLGAMDLLDAERVSVRTPVGVYLGAKTPEEIALSILGSVVQAFRSGDLGAVDRSTPILVREAIDPVCGMTVIVRPDTPHKVVDGVDYWYCCTGCRDR